MSPDSRSGERDAAAVARYLGGDPSGFEDLVQRHAKPLYAFIRRYLQDPQSAQDVFQETLMAALKSLERFDTSRAFLPWLLGIAANRCREESRRAQKGRIDPDLADALSRPPEPSPDQVAATRETAARVAQAVSHLDDAHRAVFLLRVYEGFTYAEIGATLNISEGTAKSRMHYAVYNVRKKMRENR